MVSSPVADPSRPPVRRRSRLVTSIVRSWRWGVMAVVAAVLIALPSVVAAWPVDEPTVEIATVLDRIEGSSSQPLQGLFESRGGAHLPDLGRYDDEVEMFNQTTRVRVWYDGPEHWRADEVSTAGETGWYREPDGLWRWRSGRRRVLFVARLRQQDEPARFPRSMDLAPQELGRRLVVEARAHGDPITRISARRVAGRTGLGIRIVPADASITTIRAADLWVDASTGVVLRVELHTAARVPMLETSFLDLSLTAPAAGTLRFDPGETGVAYRRSPTVDAIETLDGRSDPLPDRLGDLDRREVDPSGVQTYGAGLSVVAAFAVPRNVLGRGVVALPSTVRPWGGEATVVPAGLVNVEIVDTDSTTYVLAGTVPISVLDDMAAALVSADS